MSSIPMPIIFLAIKAGHVEAVQRLLECGARTDMHLTPKVRRHLHSQIPCHKDVTHMPIKNVVYLDQLDQVC